MRRTAYMFGVVLLKFFLTVTAMTFLFLTLGVAAYGPITLLAAFLGGGDLLREILTHALLIISILSVSFVEGLFLPRDRAIVRLAAIASVLLSFADFIRTEIYIAVHIVEGSPFPYGYVGSVAIQFALILLLSYWLSVVVHSSGRALTRAGIKGVRYMFRSRDCVNSGDSRQFR